MNEWQFVIRVTGAGDTRQEAWEDAKDNLATGDWSDMPEEFEFVGRDEPAQCPKCGEQIGYLVALVTEDRLDQYLGDDEWGDGSEVVNTNTQQYSCPHCQAVLANTSDEADMIFHEN